MTGYLTVGGNLTETFADYKVEIKDGYGTGEDNHDVIGISWVPDDYDLQENGTRTQDATNAYLKDSSFDGALWGFDDFNACGWGCDLSFSVATDMDKTTTETPRKIEATYQTVWNESTSVVGFSVDSSGSMSLSVSGGGGQTYVEQIDRQVVKESQSTEL